MLHLLVCAWFGIIVGGSAFMSQSDSHRCRASRSSWRAVLRILRVGDGVVNDGVVIKKFYG